MRMLKTISFVRRIEIFGKLKRGKSGQHKTTHSGQGEERGTDRRAYEFGDNLDQIALTDSLRNAQANHGFSGDYLLTEDDLEVVENEYRSQTSTVLMIDISHSMILYGEDRITPAKKVAMALAELIKTRYPKDTLDIIVCLFRRLRSIPPERWGVVISVTWTIR